MPVTWALRREPGAGRRMRAWLRGGVLAAALSALAWPAHAGLGEGLAAYTRGDYAAALKEIEPAAEGGNAHAQFLLGVMHLQGHGVRRDDAQAARWFRRAANQGVPAAQGQLGRMLAAGRGVPRHERDAAEWWQRGADRGDPDSQGLLGMAYAEGSGVAKDAKKAYFWLLLATARAEGDALRRFQRERYRLERELGEAERLAVQDEASRWRPLPATRFVVPASPPAPSAAEARAAAPSRPAHLRASSGTGIVVARERVVTNHHVTRGCERLRVAGKEVDGVLASDAHADLALLAVPGAGEPAAIRVGPASVGEAAAVAGFPLSGLLSGFNMTTGNVSGLGGLRGDARLVQVTAPVQPGNSGGPLLDAGGTVIGVVVSKLNALRIARVTGDVPQNVNFAIAADVLASFLDAQGVRYARADPHAPDLPAEEIARRARAFTVLVECWK